MSRLLFALLWIIPVGWCRRDTDNRIWRSRRGGVVVLSGDVFANLGEWFRFQVYRDPDDTVFIRSESGRIIGTMNRSPFGKKKP